MAKVKVKLDVTAIKKWLLEHGEKVALGFALLIFLVFTWSAISREVLDASKQPQQLQQQATNVGAHVTKSPWEEKTAGIQIIAYDERAKFTRVEPAAFPLVNDLNKPLADPKTKRAVPKLLPIEELKVASGFGTFALKDEAAAPTPGAAGRRTAAGPSSAASNLKGLPWVAITGLVPVQKQALEYARVFDRSLGGNREKDAPSYAGFKIERAEIGDQDPAKLDWKPLVPSPITKQFEAGLAEVVRAEFVDPDLTMPLRPLIGAAWGAAVTHPKIPLADQSKAQSPPPPQPVAAEDSKEADPQAADDGLQRAHTKKAAPAQAVSPAADAAKPDDVEFGYRLFRAFDFTVEPNKKYRYRVVVGLENPNFGLSRQYLKDPESATKEVLTTDPTEPSGVISVPDGYQLLAGGVKPPKLGEPAAKLLLIAIDKEIGIEATYEHDVLRGTVANTIVKELLAHDPRNPSKNIEMSDVKFKSDMVVLDIRGGKKMSGPRGTNLVVPGEVLLLDRNGDLVVRSELDDQSMYDSRKPPEEPESKAKPEPIPDPPKPGGKPKRVKPQR